MACLLEHARLSLFRRGEVESITVVVHIERGFRYALDAVPYAQMRRLMTVVQDVYPEMLRDVATPEVLRCEEFHRGMNMVCGPTDGSPLFTCTAEVAVEMQCPISRGSKPHTCVSACCVHRW